ncbi:hypothetical protein A3E42_06505 [Candidatus Gottesmanbacteria bacterium RIFCSPHIGHO2_12_FULL_40_13]|uniref:Uncharacterized protein n=1 Tax=Candidatus Gottesmanbacteria bacterium RIFCSPHIGHO2_01_FULL_40_15 TaxID=1798376 RepID=A0A1F5Z3J6_9BACT|nr:MAG: hypothetical protein A2777_03955 [Candidatus Gottesmanbacteria bacterium RIFCSPHIGHO2_01_FULL_40_15]OGG22975.1 MAG: hypothetical protein A3E42_06505 [Candidatus Gottesmanbacteria bacterium RIFCSPHIGHO2_12_FULL_40_13]
MAPDALIKQPIPDELNAEKESQNQQTEAYVSEVPEGEMTTMWAGVLTYIAANPLNKQERVLEALKRINRPNFEYELLKVRYGGRFQSLKVDFELVKKEVGKQRKSKKGQQRGYAQVGMGPFKRFKEKIDFDAFDHKEQAYHVAAAVQNRINAQELRGKIEKTAEIYNLNPENSTKLARGIADWQRKNPGKHIDEYFQKTGQHIQYTQQPSKDNFFKRRKKEKEITGALYSELNGVRLDTIKANREQIISAQAEVKKLLEGPVVSREELYARIKNTLHPIEPVSTLPLSEAALPATKMPEAATTTGEIPIKQQADTGPRIPLTLSGGLPQHASPRISIPALKELNLPKLGNFLGKAKNFTNLGGSLIQKGLFKLGGKLALKAGLQAGLGTATGGIYTAASIIAGLIGIDLDKFALKAALFAVFFPIGLVLIMLFVFMNFKSLNKFPSGVDLAYPVKAKISPENQAYSWNTFEKQILEKAFADNKLWDKFEREVFLDGKEFLSSKK